MAFYLIIRGPLGSGKTTVSKKLTEELGAKYFAVDEVLEENNLTEDKEEGYISQRSFKKVNELVEAEARTALEGGKPVIFDGNFYWQSQIEDLIERLPYPYKVFTLRVPVEICIKRDLERVKTNGKDAAMVVHSKSTSFTYGIEIDGTGSVEETLGQIKAHLQKLP